MARGSDGGAGGGNNFKSIEMLQSGGQVDNSGKYTVSRKYYVTEESDLITTPASISVNGKSMSPSALSYQKISGGVWEKTIDFTAPAKSSETGVVKALSATDKKQLEGRMQMDVSAELAPIEQHPEITDLIKKYNGTTQKGKVIFPEKYREAGTNGTAIGPLKTNPFFGVRYYYQPAATLRHTYTLEKMPADIWKGVFCIVKTEQLPGGFPPLDDYLNKEGATLKYYWQIQMPQIALVGGRIEITDTYTLLKPMTEKAAQDFNKIAAG
jgi:hypothetical protein